MSARKKVNVEENVEEKEISSATNIASRFAEEAYWDLRIAERLLAGLDLGTCDQNDEVFYTGRRVLYLLQQASEKAAKAHLVAYFRVWLKIIKLAILGYHKEDRHLLDILTKLEERLEPKRIRHAPHRAISDLLCRLYELFYKNKSSMLRYVKSISRGLLPYFRAYVRDENEVAELMLGPLRKLELPKGVQGTIEQLCEGEEADKKSLAEALRELRSLREDFERRVEEALARGPTEEHLVERAKHLLNEFAKALEDAGRAKAGTKECLERLATSGAETLVHHAKEFILGSLYSYYLLAYFFIIYPHLAIYETIGRYPEYENRGSVCQDIGKLDLLIEEVRLLVSKVKHFAEEFKSLSLVCLEDRNRAELKAGTG
jgi:hypothetical protein